MTTHEMPTRLAALLSGGGRTLMNLADRIDDDSLAAQIDLVIASRADASGVEKARDRGFDVQIIERSKFDSEESMHAALTKLLLSKPIDLVCLCGYLLWLDVPTTLRGKVINIHPALLPDFGGKGMYGLRVHRAVLDSGRTETGCTVHFVDEQYDHGPTILQRTCPVLQDDTPKTLAARVFAQECIAYPQAIRQLTSGKVRTSDANTHNQTTT